MALTQGKLLHSVYSCGFSDLLHNKLVHHAILKIPLLEDSGPL